MEGNSYEIHLAPLQGFTDYIFRNAFEKYFGGVDAYYPPFIRLENGKVRNKDLRDIQAGLNTVPRLIPQILPGSSQEFRLLTEIVRDNGYTEIDINLGCPFPLIAGKRKGAGMLPYPEQVQEVLQTVNEYPDIRFSLKIRLGWENVCECQFLSSVFNSVRLDHITVHARTGKQQYKGVVDEEAFARFSEMIRHPLFYNGDIRCRQDVERIFGKFPVLRGVLIGRGLLSSPLLANEFKRNETFSEEKRMSLCSDFHEELFFAYSGVLQGESQLLSRMKALWEYFLPSTDRKILKKIRKATRLSQYKECVKWMK